MEHIHGGDIYSRNVRLDFSANLNPLGMPESVRQAAIRGVMEGEHYPDVECRDLLRTVSEAEGIAPEHILFGNGAAELIFAVAMARKPQKALLVTPGFAEYEMALSAIGCDITYYACTRENGFQIGEDYLTYLTADIEMAFLCNPNNPTGLPIDEALLNKVIDRCREKGILLVVDECFNGLWINGEGRSVKHRIEEVPELFILRAFTKLYSMAGLRLGYAFTADDALKARIRQLLQPWNVSIPAQMAGCAAMQLLDHPAKSRAYVGDELSYLKEAFRSLGLTFWESEANYLFFEGPEDLKERCLNEGILIRSCSNYRGLRPGYFRVAVRTRQENDELIRTLHKVLENEHRK